MKRYIVFIPALILAVHLSIGSSDLHAQTTETENPEVVQKSILKVYYVHTTYRCANCKKFEKWSKETVDQFFTNRLKDGSLTYDKINIEDKKNKHFVEDYRLVTKSIILSKVVNDEEATWKNLDKIWTLLSDENKFKEYIRDEIEILLKDRNT